MISLTDTIWTLNKLQLMRALFSQVNVQVSVVDGNVQVNGAKAYHSEVTTFHLEAEIGRYQLY